MSLSSLRLQCLQGGTEDSQPLKLLLGYRYPDISARADQLTGQHQNGQSGKTHPTQNRLHRGTLEVRDDVCASSSAWMVLSVNPPNTEAIKTYNIHEFYHRQTIQLLTFTEVVYLCDTQSVTAACSIKSELNPYFFMKLCSCFHQLPLLICKLWIKDKLQLQQRKSTPNS